MKKLKTIMKYSFIALATLSAISIPVITVVSCSDNKTPDQPEGPTGGGGGEGPISPGGGGTNGGITPGGGSGGSQDGPNTAVQEELSYSGNIPEIIKGRYQRQPVLIDKYDQNWNTTIEKIQSNKIKWFDDKKQQIKYKVTVNINPKLYAIMDTDSVRPPNDLGNDSTFGLDNFYRYNTNPMNFSYEITKNENNNSFTKSDFTVGNILFDFKNTFFEIWYKKSKPDFLEGNAIFFDVNNSGIPYLCTTGYAFYQNGFGLEHFDFIRQYYELNKTLFIDVTSKSETSFSNNDVPSLIMTKKDRSDSGPTGSIVANDYHVDSIFSNLSGTVNIKKVLNV